MGDPSTARAVLRIYKDDLDPVAVTRLIGVLPEESFRKNQPVLTKAGVDTGRKYRIGGWLLSSEKAVSSDLLEEHVEWIVDQVLPKADAIRRLVNEGAEVNIYCTMTSYEGGFGFTLPSNVLTKFAQLDADLDIEVFFEPSDELT